LFFSSILFIAALAMFGFSETITRFDFAKAVSNSYSLGNIDIVSLLKTEEVMGWDHPEKASVPFKVSDVESMGSLHPEIHISRLYNFTGKGITVSTESKLVKPKVLKGFLEVESLDAIGANLLNGRISKSTNEIMLTDFVADYLVEEKDQFNSYNDVVNSTFQKDKKNIPLPEL